MLQFAWLKFARRVVGQRGQRSKDARLVLVVGGHEDVDIHGRADVAGSSDREASHHDILGVAVIQRATELAQVLDRRLAGRQLVGRAIIRHSQRSASSWVLKRYTPRGTRTPLNDRCHATESALRLVVVDSASGAWVRLPTTRVTVSSTLTKALVTVP